MQGLSDGQSDIRFVSDQAQAVIGILSARQEQKGISDSAWERLFSSEGYQRLKRREREMGSRGQPFDDAVFRRFVLSDETPDRAAVLAETLQRWQTIDINIPLKRALAYLPKGTSIQCRIYPVIKPKPNSFVFDLERNPALFLYLDPAKNEDRFINTLAHELHHIGYAQGCAARLEGEILPGLPARVRSVVEWIAAFGEGVAVLAAAGGPTVHPHAVSGPEAHLRWDKHLAYFGSDLKKIERFYLDILDGALKTEQEIHERGFLFFGPDQGPWYTVGWQMAATVERTSGRDTLVASLCDPRQLLSSYNKAAGELNAASGRSLALWNPALLERLDVKV